MKYEIKWFFIKLRHKINIKLAYILPHRLVMWCFIRVHAESGEAPGSYKEAYDYYTSKYKLDNL